MAAATPIPPVPLFARIKRSVAMRCLDAPGGRFIVKAARMALNLVRGYSPRGELRRAEHQIVMGRPDLALARLDRVLNHYPFDSQIRVARLNALLRLDRIDEAKAEAETLLSRPGLGEDLIPIAKYRLAEAECRSGQVEESLERTGWAEELPSRHNVAEQMINDYADFDAACAIYAGTERRQLEKQTWFGPALEGIRFYPADWVRLVGHIGLLDLVVKTHHLGWNPAKKLLLAAPPKLVANAHFLSYLRPYFEVTTDPLLLQLAEHLGPRVACRLHLPDGTAPYFCEGMGVVQEEWERQGRAPLLALTADDRQVEQELRQKLGIPADGWVVTLHARSPGFHWESGTPHQAHRNTDIKTYLPAIQEITRRGGWVVRLGDQSMPKLPALAGVVDYAHSPHKSQRADVILCAISRFFIGCASGLCHLPVTFGVPTLLTNWCSNQLPMFSGRDRFVPKRLRERETGRELTFTEMLRPATRIAAYSGTKLISSGFEWIDNSAEDILDGVREMLDEPVPPNEWAAEYDRLAREIGLRGFSRLANGFAARHANLLRE